MIERQRQKDTQQVRGTEGKRKYTARERRNKTRVTKMETMIEVEKGR